jgi:uncharacterized membrane protein YfcA
VVIELSIFGIITGFVSGFFGVGGGMLLVPMLLNVGFVMKEAVSISILQMVFSSTYGTFLNYKQNKNLLKDGLVIGFGGFVGGFQNGFIHAIVSNEFLENFFLMIIIFSIYQIGTSSPLGNETKKSQNKALLFLIGFLIGAIAMSIGVGGSVMLTPLLVGYLFYNLKDASSLGLFFVIFSSIAGFISLSVIGEMLYYEGLIVGISSLIGVFIGIKMKQIVHIKNYKKYLLILNSLILIGMVYKMFIK